MLSRSTIDTLPNDIKHLLEQRAQHTAAIDEIDATLARVSAALGGPGINHKGSRRRSTGDGGGILAMIQSGLDEADEHYRQTGRMIAI